MLTTTHDTGTLWSRIALAVALLVVALAAANWYLEPDRASRWLEAAVTVPTLWAGMMFVKWLALRVRAPRSDDEAVQHYSAAAGRFFTLAIAAIGLNEATALAFDLASSLDLLNDLEFARRVVGATAGLVLVVLGNGLPKVITPMSLLPGGGAARMTTMRRFVGRAWVLVGLTMMLVFLLAPLAVSRQMSPWLVVIGVVATLGGIVWLNVWPTKREA